MMSEVRQLIGYTVTVVSLIVACVTTLVYMKGEELPALYLSDRMATVLPWSVLGGIILAFALYILTSSQRRIERGGTS
jgi:hypothetical protein